MKQKAFLLSVFLAAYFNSFSQSDSPQINDIDRSLARIIRLEKDIPKLPVSKEELTEVITPEIHTKRDELAPHYPLCSNFEDQGCKDNFKGWIQNFPEEFMSYTHYLELEIRSYRK